MAGHGRGVGGGDPSTCLPSSSISLPLFGPNSRTRAVASLHTLVLRTFLPVDHLLPILAGLPALRHLGMNCLRVRDTGTGLTALRNAPALRSLSIHTRDWAHLVRLLHTAGSLPLSVTELQLLLGNPWSLLSPPLPEAGPGVAPPPGLQRLYFGSRDVAPIWTGGGSPVRAGNLFGALPRGVALDGELATPPVGYATCRSAAGLEPSRQFEDGWALA